MSTFPRTTRLIIAIRSAFHEPHPTEFKPALLKSAPVPWLSVYAKRQIRTMGFVAPALGLFLGWPYLASLWVKWGNGVYDSSREEGRPEKVERPRVHQLRRRLMLAEGPVRVEQ